MSDYGVLFAISCWFIWKAQNNEVFADKVILDLTLINQTYSLYKITSKIFSKQKKEPQQRLIRCAWWDTKFACVMIDELVYEGMFSLIVFCFYFHWKQKMMIKICLIRFLKIFSVKMKIIKFHFQYFQLKTGTSFWVK